MLTVLSFMLGGVLCGFLLRGRAVVRAAGRLVIWVIYLLLLLLGVSVGSDPGIMDRLGTIGGRAALLAFGAVLGSAAAARWIYRRFFGKGGGR